MKLEKWQEEEIEKYWQEEIGFPMFHNSRTVQNEQDIRTFSAPFLWIIHKENGCEFIMTKESEIQNRIYLSDEMAEMLMQVLEEMYL